MRSIFNCSHRTTQRFPLESSWNRLIGLSAGYQPGRECPDLGSSYATVDDLTLLSQYSKGLETTRISVLTCDMKFQ
jgi:hypothetical protein